MTIDLPASPARPLLTHLLRAALTAVEAGHAVRRAVRKRGALLTLGRRRYDLRRYDRIAVAGAGKAAAAMARAVEDLLGSRLERGLVIVKYQHAAPRPDRIVIAEAGHPIPDASGVRATRRLLKLAASLSPRDLLIVLLSGGASSLMPAPVPGVSLKDKQRVTELLLTCGADIVEINSVRKHLSLIKGGRLAQSTTASILALILSDVPGDDVSAVGSGPTAPDPTTFGRAIECLKRYRVWPQVPSSARRHLLRGKGGHVIETPKPRASLFRRVDHHVIGNNRLAVAAAADAARTAGIAVSIDPRMLSGEASRAGRAFAALARAIVDRDRPLPRPCCVIAGGETTVTVRGNGRGGRAQEFALAAAKVIAGLKNTWIMAVGTDGTDGPTDVAGAVVDGQTAGRAARLGIDLDEALEENNTYPVLKKLRAHVRTGPTRTNVNDLYLLLVL
ncbi:MAG TPA: DUF4147 domain-containing protein [Nitrospira sp.]|nr:DUF4147 domain-containing protein [Nitrospira sp.]